jgi:hypothetical protein
MTIEFEIDTYKIPAFALSAIVNGDYSGIIDDDDEAFVDNLCEWLDEEYGAGNWHIGDVSEQYFGRSDFSFLPSEVCDVDIAYKLVDLD